MLKRGMIIFIGTLIFIFGFSGKARSQKPSERSFSSERMKYMSMKRGPDKSPAINKNVAKRTPSTVDWPVMQSRYAMKTVPPRTPVAGTVKPSQRAITPARRRQ